jgi:hypothetical protein
MSPTNTANGKARHERMPIRAANRVPLEILRGRGA